jgi:hypothetical protein
MCDFSDVSDRSLDLLIIDGGPRNMCLMNGFGKVRPGGHIYLDNWDVEEFWRGTGAFLEARAQHIREMCRFIDYAPASFVVNEGMLITLAEAASAA